MGETPRNNLRVEYGSGLRQIKLYYIRKTACFRQQKRIYINPSSVLKKGVGGVYTFCFNGLDLKEKLCKCTSMKKFSANQKFSNNISFDAFAINKHKYTYITSF